MRPAARCRNWAGRSSRPSMGGVRQRICRRDRFCRAATLPSSDARDGLVVHSLGNDTCGRPAPPCPRKISAHRRFAFHNRRPAGARTDASLPRKRDQVSDAGRADNSADGCRSTSPAHLMAAAGARLIDVVGTRLMAQSPPRAALSTLSRAPMPLGSSSPDR